MHSDNLVPYRKALFSSFYLNGAGNFKILIITELKIGTTLSSHIKLIQMFSRVFVRNLHLHLNSKVSKDITTSRDVHNKSETDCGVRALFLGNLCPENKVYGLRQ